MENQPAESQEQIEERKEITKRYNQISAKLEKKLGFKLTNIELIGLRRIIEEVIREVKKGKEEKLGFMNIPMDYYGEIYSRWFPEFLDIRYDELKFDEKGNIDDFTKKYLKMKHEEPHLL